MSRIAAASLMFCLAGCGLKAPYLSLPPGPAPEPLFGVAKPAPVEPAKPASNESDVSTDRKPDTQ
jgi:predicted small lipoprotein YifL